MNFKSIAETKSKEGFIEDVKSIMSIAGFTDFSIHTLRGSSDLGLSSIPTELSRAIFGNEIIQKHFENGGDDFFISYVLRCDVRLDVDLFPGIAEEMVKNKFGDAVIMSYELSRYNKIALVGLFAKEVDSSAVEERVASNGDMVKFLASGLAHFAAHRLPDALIGPYSALQKTELSDYDHKSLAVLHSLAAGMTLRQTADKLCMALDTANKHIKNAKKLLDARTTPEAVGKAVKLGIVGG